MRLILKIFGILLSALLTGWISIHFFAGWYCVIPWSLVTLTIGYLQKTGKIAAASGAVFGYFLFLGYLILGYKGLMDTDSLLHFLLFSVAFSLIGAAAGMAGGLTGYWIKKKFSVIKKNAIRD